MAGLHAGGRPERFTRRERQMVAWTKALLVEALRDMPTIRPPRLDRQDKADLERIVRGALDRPDGDPVRVAMIGALDRARSYLAGSQRW